MDTNNNFFPNQLTSGWYALYNPLKGDFIAENFWMRNFRTFLETYFIVKSDIFENQISDYGFNNYDEFVFNIDNDTLINLISEMWYVITILTEEEKENFQGNYRLQ